MQPGQIVIIAWLIFAISFIFICLIKGQRLLKKFPNLNKSAFEFSENSVSGYATQSFKTKMGGARKVLRIRVTSDELWISTNYLIAVIAERHDLIHRILIKSLLSVKNENKHITVVFEKDGKRKEIVLMSKRQQELVQLLNSKMTKAPSK